MTTAAFVAMMVTALTSFAMTVTTLMPFAMMMTAFVTFSVMMAMVVALGIGVIFQSSFSEGSRRSIRRSLYTGIELNSCISKRHLSTHTDTSADQSISLYRLQEACKSSVTASIGINDLLIDDRSLFNIIQLELFGMTEVLEDFSVFICDCDSHDICSFLDDLLIDLDRFVFTVSACDQQPFPIHKGVSDLFSCAVIDGSYRGPGNVHPGCTDFLCKTFVIQKSQCLKFVHGHLNAFCGCDVIRRETAIDRKLLYSTASEWSWHKHSFLTYVNISIISLMPYVNNEASF